MTHNDDYAAPHRQCLGIAAISQAFSQTREFSRPPTIEMSIDTYGRDFCAAFIGFTFKTLNLKLSLRLDITVII